MSASRPVTSTASPCSTCMPLCITPNARARKPFGSTWTNSPFAAGNCEPMQKPQTAAISTTPTTGGLATAGTSVSGASTANTRIIRRRVSGGTSRPISSPPMIQPTGLATMIRPWNRPRLSPCPARSAAHAAARPSGTMAKSMPAKTITAMARSTRVPKTSR